MWLSSLHGKMNFWEGARAETEAHITEKQIKTGFLAQSKEKCYTLLTLAQQTFCRLIFPMFNIFLRIQICEKFKFVKNSNFLEFKIQF